MQIARRRGMKKAIVALARRLDVIMPRIWDDGTGRLEKRPHYCSVVNALRASFRRSQAHKEDRLATPSMSNAKLNTRCWSSVSES